MARKQVRWTATHGRDKGRVFIIREMSADQAERWCIRALLALANGGAKVPDELMDAGVAGMASMAGALVVSLRTLQGMDYAAVGPLLDEMLECVKFQPVGTAGEVLPPQDLLEGDNCQIEEIKTRFQLRWEVLQVHTDFSLADALAGFQQTKTEAAPVPSA
jgi:hypothetical protein